MLPLVAFMAFQTADLQLPRIFSDNMVLQRGMPVPFFGTATPGATVRVDMNGKFANATAGPSGAWMVKLRPMREGGPYTVCVTAGKTIEFKNVVVGEVWVASGQSNMEWSQGNSSDLAQALQETDPLVRMFTVAKVSVEEPAKDV